jgi:hypothetical protein
MRKKERSLLLPKSLIKSYLEDLNQDEQLELMNQLFNWYLGNENPPIQHKMVKVLYDNVLPVFESHKDNYTNGDLGGAPVGNQNARKKDKTTETTETTPVVLKNKPKDKDKEKDKDINSSKEELINTEQPSSSEDESVVSKGLESLEKIFPQGRNYVGIDEVNLWNSLTQEEKKVMIKRASMYVRNEKKKEDGKYIKGMGKWMREQTEKGLQEQLPSMKNSTKADDPRLLKMTDGSIYSILLEKVSGQTKQADKLYYLLNKKEMFTSKGELLSFVTSLNQREINDLIN